MSPAGVAGLDGERRRGRSAAGGARGRAAGGAGRVARGPAEAQSRQSAAENLPARPGAADARRVPTCYSRRAASGQGAPAAGADAR